MHGGLQRHGRRKKRQLNTTDLTLAHLPKWDQAAEHNTVEHRKQVSAVKGYQPAASLPFLPRTNTLQYGSLTASPDMRAKFSRAQKMGNHSLTGTLDTPNACHAQGASEARGVQKSVPGYTGFQGTLSSMRQCAQMVKPPQQRQEKSCCASAGNEAARKLLEQLELETAESLNELERLVEEQHSNICFQHNGC